jgi:hypothetical protein
MRKNQIGRHICRVTYVIWGEMKEKEKSCNEEGERRERLQ